jgi:spore germination protein GerM
MSRFRRLRASVALALGALLMASCGLPGSGSARAVDGESVPFRLLDRGPSTQEPSKDGPILDKLPVVFWLVDDEFLVPASMSASCDEQLEVLVERLLGELAAGPREEARAAGRATAIPPESRLGLVEIRDATARVEVDPASEISADRLPVAVGQIVLSVASAPGVEAVTLVSGGESIQVPLPGGALTSGPVKPSDYASLVPERLQDPTTSPLDLVPGLGCP